MYLYKAVFSESLNISFKHLQFKHSRNHRAKICHHCFLREIESNLIDLAEGGFEYLPSSTRAASPWGFQSQSLLAHPLRPSPSSRQLSTTAPSPALAGTRQPPAECPPFLLQGETPAANAGRRKEALQAQPVTTLQVLWFTRQSEEACFPSPPALQVV